MTSILQWALYLLALAVTTWIIWYWNRGAQRRRFRKAYPEPTETPWTTEEDAFLRCFETAYRLPRGWGKRLPKTATPMQVYLTLYPEHCIYDAGEITRLTAAFVARNISLPPHELTTLPLGDLAQRYSAVPSSVEESPNP